MAEGSIAEQLDVILANFFSSWNIYTTILAIVVCSALVYPLLTGQDPDVHPFLLARQAQVSPIRHSGESAVYRAAEIPYGYPLRAGLGVKDPGAPKWSPGRNGDLRDIWRQAVRGPVKDDGSSAGPKGRVMTVLGREKVVEHDLVELTTQINAIGKYVQEKGRKKVAVCLSNSTELLCVVFAGAFYEFSPILIPYGLSQDVTMGLLSAAKPDILIAEAGTLDLSTVFSTKSIQTVILVVKEGSKHMDWAETPSNAPASINVSTWHELVQEGKSTSSQEVPGFEKDAKSSPLSMFSLTSSGAYNLIEYTPENLVSGIAALGATLSRTHRFSSSDILLPTTSLTDSFTLCWTLAALFSYSSIALNSVAGDSVNLIPATAGLSPTIIIASPSTISTYYSSTIKSKQGVSAQVSKYFQSRTLQAGNMPTKRPAVAISNLSKLRVLLIPQSLGGSNTTKLSSNTLSDLRLLLGSRIGYALTHPHVAGAVSQTNILDYRNKGSRIVCIGPPLSSVEVSLIGEDKDVDGVTPKGKIVVKGPSVIGGKAELDIVAQIDDDNTLLIPA